MRLIVTCSGVTVVVHTEADAIVASLYPTVAVCRLCNSRTGQFITSGQTVDEAGLLEDDMLFCLQHDCGPLVDRS